MKVRQQLSLKEVSTGQLESWLHEYRNRIDEQRLLINQCEDGDRLQHLYEELSEMRDRVSHLYRELEQRDDGNVAVHNGGGNL